MHAIFIYFIMIAKLPLNLIDNGVLRKLYNKYSRVNQDCFAENT